MDPGVPGTRYWTKEDITFRYFSEVRDVSGTPFDSCTEPRELGCRFGHGGWHAATRTQAPTAQGGIDLFRRLHDTAWPFDHLLLGRRFVCQREAHLAEQGPDGRSRQGLRADVLEDHAAPLAAAGRCCMGPERIKLEGPVEDVDSKRARAQWRVAHIAAMPPVLPSKEFPALAIAKADDDGGRPRRVRPVNVRLGGECIKLYACPPEGG